MVFIEPAAKRQRLGTVAIDSEGRTHAEYKRQAKEENAAHSHNVKYGFLNDLRDLQGRRPGAPGYDTRKLYVPEASLAAMTNFERQYWEIKMQNWDTVLFFKKGKFYELYEKDADIGHQEFDLKMVDTARSSMRMVGIPEQGFNLWAARFIGAGHKIGRVEQMVTRTQLDRGGSKAAIVPRELCQVLTLGTITELDMFMDHTPHYLLAIKEISSSYGVVIADTSRGLFRFAYIPEDEQRSAFVTLLHSTKPKEVLLERGQISKVALTCIDKELSGVRKTFLTSKTEFPDITKSIRHFQEAAYFETVPVIASLQPYWENELVMSAFGAMALYLQDSKQDKELLSMKNFAEYDPSMGGKALTLDGTTLCNLEVLENAQNKGLKGTLLEYLDHCSWAVGRRKFHQWLCSPLRVVGDILKRQDSVTELIEKPDKRNEIKAFLAKLPDLERCLSRLGLAGREREVAWVDPVSYNKKIVTLFIETLNALKSIDAFITTFEGTVESSLLGSLTAFKEAGGMFPSFKEAITNFENAFDSKKAALTGDIEPFKGAHEKFDAAVETRMKLQGTLDEYLAEVKDHYKASVKYVSVGKDHYLIEVPASAGSSVFSGFELKNSTKAARKYVAKDISKLIEKMQVAKEEVDSIRRTVLKDILLRFSDNVTVWKEVINCLADVDCLCSLAIVSSMPGMCKPVVKDKDAKVYSGAPYLIAKGVEHPLVRPAVGSKVDTVVANDIVLGGPSPAVSLITGPNMGGKSTVMRSACVVIIFAQLGCYVPATSVELTPVDRIFTRIGASDRILSGLSTFMVEMREVSLNKMSYEIDPVTRSVTFLYKFISGATTESYGVDVAKKARIPTHILQRAQAKADEFREANVFHVEHVLTKVAKQVYDALMKGDPVAVEGARMKACSLLSMN